MFEMLFLQRFAADVKGKKSLIQKHNFFLPCIWGHVALSADSVLPQDLKSILSLIWAHLLNSSPIF